MTINSTKIGIIQQKFDLFNNFREEFNKCAFPPSKARPFMHEKAHSIQNYCGGP
jgi:hypothetical protein